MTTSDTSTATLLYPTTASGLCINGSVGCGRKITWGPGLRAGMQRSLDTGTAWPYYRPASRTLRLPEDELEDAVGGGEHAARERESERSE